MARQEVEHLELEIGLAPKVWRAIRRAVANEQARKEPRFSKLIPACLDKIDNALLAFDSNRCHSSKRDKPNYDAGSPDIVLKSTYFSWCLLADLVLIWGDQDAKSGGHRIVVGLSQMRFGAAQMEGAE